MVGERFRVYLLHLSSCKLLRASECPQRLCMLPLRESMTQPRSHDAPGQKEPPPEWPCVLYMCWADYGLVLATPLHLTIYRIEIKPVCYFPHPANTKGLESPGPVRQGRYADRVTSRAGVPKAGRAQTLPGKTNTSPVCHNPPRETEEIIPPKLSLGPSEFMELQEYR